MNCRQLLIRILISCMLVNIACREVTSIGSPPTSGQPTPTRVSTSVTATSSVSPTAPSAGRATRTPTRPAISGNGQPALTPTRPPAVVPPGRFDRTPITDAERMAAESLRQRPPDRDDRALASAYRATATPAPTTTPSPPLEVGAKRSLNVLNIDNNTIVAIDATLRGVSEAAYFWFDNAGTPPDPAVLAQVGAAFDTIYVENVAAFGQEPRPGIDGESRLHIVHAAPGTLCVDPEACGLAGYFSGRDALPRTVNPRSNEMDMFVMNAAFFGTSFYLNVLAHEFRHMIEANHDVSDADWEVEGSATLAEELAGFEGSALARGNIFLAEPDQQLNRWTDGSTTSYYGMGYVLNRYIYGRLGPALYREFATDPHDGLGAVTAVAWRRGLPLDGISLWEDWLVAMAIHNHPGRPEQYALGDSSLDTAAMVPVTDYPARFETTVHQFAADYYELSGEGTINLNFEGSRRVPVLDTATPAGSHFWLANRSNYGHAQLTRNVDLGDVSKATLHYKVYYDIEYGYDFAYVSVSTDGGATWQGLEAEGMQGRLPADDPSGSALTDRFYTGREAGWTEEAIDLSPYAGQEILLRFSYVTDPILTFAGLALDEISIPEIGLYDGAETMDEGWTAAGFTRATAMLPQEWHLQLITFSSEVPFVSPLVLDEGALLNTTIDLGASNGEAILIVAARAPQTLETAHYRLTLSEE